MTVSHCAPVDGRDSRKGHLSVKGTRRASVRKSAKSTRQSCGLAVLPGEDEKAYRGRLKAWTGSLEPRNPVELYLVERAVILSWQLDRADRAQIDLLTSQADRRRSEAAASDDTPAPLVAFDDSESGDRLRRFQLGCGRALYRTLHAFARMRAIGEARAVAMPVGPAAASPDRAEDPAPSNPAPAGADSSQNGELAAALPSQIAAVLAEILAAVGPADAPTIRYPTTAQGPLPAVAVVGPAGDRSEPRTQATDRPASSPRRRIPAPRHRQTGWSAARGPAKARTEADDSKSRPICRNRPRPDATSEPTESRRRVGGYEVPLDPSVPVSCADRIPVRLRREASAARLK